MNTSELLKILVCPACHEDLRLEKKDDGAQGFYCAHCDLLYPVEDEIPIMLIEKAAPLAVWQKEVIKS